MVRDVEVRIPRRPRLVKVRRNHEHDRHVLKTQKRILQARALNKGPSFTEEEKLMKPGKYDRQAQVLIAGPELQELQRHTWMMAESFGLDRRIENYRGIRPIGLYRWDIELLLMVIDSALQDAELYPHRGDESYLAMENLQKRLQKTYREYF